MSAIAVLRCAWLVPLLLLAGCTGGATKAAVNDPVPSVAAEALIDDEHGAIKGFVLDTESMPVAGTQLLLTPGVIPGTSALDGSYVFSMLSPGTYTIYSSRLGYKGPQTAVDVVANEVTTADIELVPIPVSHPRTKVIGPYSGYMQCYMATPLSSRYCGFLPVVGDPGDLEGQYVWTRDKNEVLFNLEGEDWEQIVFDAKWTPSSAATNPKWEQVLSFKGRPNTHFFARSNDTVSPNQYIVEKGKPGPNGPSLTEPREIDVNLTLRSWMTLPFGEATTPINLAYEMRYETYVTVFYARVAPPNYSAFEDA